ncbi:MAG: S-layer homology domain-containing protein [Ruminococcaceae bacterium]|nr:S-layer homology domain-containing protein [Oscillospiraceae bacterium]
MKKIVSVLLLLSVLLSSLSMVAFAAEGGELPAFIEVTYRENEIETQLHQNVTLQAYFDIPDGAEETTIQWYVASTPAAWGEIYAENCESIIDVPTDEEGSWYYRCHVTCKVGEDYISSPTEEFATVKLTVKGSGVPSMFFDDVKVGDWFYHDVEYVYYNLLMNGVGDGKFAPNATTTRGMIVTILHRMEGQPEMTAECPFVDVAAGSYYEKAITWAAFYGIVNGVGDNKFAPDDNITREQFAAIFFRYAQYKGWYNEDDCVMTGGFADQNQVSDWAFEAMSWAIGVELINGMQTSDGLYLMPQGNAIRCQAAAIIHRFCEYFNK